MEQIVTSVDKINFSNSQVQSIMNSAVSETKKVPTTMFPAYVRAILLFLPPKPSRIRSQWQRPQSLPFSKPSFFPNDHRVPRSLLCTGCHGLTLQPVQIDVRDLAELQIRALTNPGAANKRFVVGFPMWFNDFADALRDGHSRVGANNDDPQTLAPARFYTHDADVAFEAFRYHSLRETAVDTAARILAVEAASARN